MEQLENLEKMKAYLATYWRESSRTDKGLMLALVFALTWKNLAPVFLILSFILALTERNSGTFFRKLLLSPRSVLLWMMAFYLFHIVGMAWSANAAFGWSDVGMKLSFLFVPLIVATGRLQLSFHQWMRRIIDVMSAIVIGLLLFAVWKSFRAPEDNHWGYFFESEYSTFLHRSYWATYCAIAASWALFDWISGPRKMVSWRLFTFFILSTSVILTISKAGIIILGIVCFWLMIHQVIVRKWWKIALPGFIVVIGLIVGVAYFSPRVASRFQEIPKAFSSVKTTNNTEIESNTARIIMWSTSWKVIQSNWLAGAGTGDVKDVLITKNLELGNTGVAEMKLNAHNQFLNSWVQLGLAGFLFLTGIFAMSFANAARYRVLPLSLMTLAFFVTMLFESFVETQGGIIPFCLLMAVLNQRALASSDL